MYSRIIMMHMDKHPEAKMIGITCDHHQSIYPPVIKVTMENTLFIGDFPIETPISFGFLTATFDYRRVSMFHSWNPIGSCTLGARAEIPWETGGHGDGVQIIHSSLENSHIYIYVYIEK